MTPTPDAYWLALRRVHGVGPRISRLLLERFQGPERIFAASDDELVQTGIPKPTARNIRTFTDFDPIERELCELPRIGARLVRWSDADYPVNLRHIADPPPYFFLRGSLDVSLEDALGLLDRYARTHGYQLTEVSRSLMTEPCTRPTILAVMRELIDAPS